MRKLLATTTLVLGFGLAFMENASAAATASEANLLTQSSYYYGHGYQGCHHADQGCINKAGFGHHHKRHKHHIHHHHHGHHHSDHKAHHRGHHHHHGHHVHHRHHRHHAHHVYRTYGGAIPATQINRSAVSHMHPSSAVAR